MCMCVCFVVGQYIPVGQSGTSNLWPSVRYQVIRCPAQAPIVCIPYYEIYFEFFSGRRSSARCTINSCCIGLSALSATHFARVPCGTSYPLTSPAPTESCPAPILPANNRRTYVYERTHAPRQPARFINSNNERYMDLSRGVSWF